MYIYVLLLTKHCVHTRYAVNKVIEIDLAIFVTVALDQRVERLVANREACHFRNKEPFNDCTI